MRQPHLCPQRLLKNFPLQPADVAVFLGQFLIRTVVLAQNREGSFGANLDVVPAAEQRITEAKDQFDRLYAESAERPKIMSIAIHPYISGQPFRIKYLEAIYDYVNQFEGVVHWNGAQILDWYNTQVTK